MSIDKQFCDDMAAAFTNLGLRIAPPAPEPEPEPAPLPVPSGYRLAWTPDLATGAGWTAESGKPNNAEGTDTPLNVSYGEGGVVLRFGRDANGKPTTADIKGFGYPVPALSAGELWYRHDAIAQGMWPAPMWFRPVDGMKGEIDILETFASHIINGKGWPVTALTLHDTGIAPDPYHLGRSPQKAMPATTDDKWHHLEWRVTKDGLFVTLNGTTYSISRQTFDARYGAGRYLALFDTDRMWYPRITLQAGGDDGGVIDPSLKSWNLMVRDLRLYVPA